MVFHRTKGRDPDDRRRVGAPDGRSVSVREVIDVYYDVNLRPAQPATPAPDAFEIHRREVPPSDGRDGLSLAFVYEGPGGYPLLLLHGYPETKRIWWRNIAALADAGYEVISPDLR